MPTETDAHDGKQRYLQRSSWPARWGTGKVAEDTLIEVSGV